MQIYFTEKLFLLYNMLGIRNIQLTILLILSIVIIFFNLGQNSFHNGDEASHALMVKNILQTGEWLTLKIEGENVFFKPPFVIWLSTLSSLVFGLSEFSIRFPSALFGILSILFTFFIAEKLFNKKTAFLSSLILLTCLQFIYVHSTKTGEFDSAIVFFFLLSIYSVIHIEERKIFFYLAFASIAIIAMIKNIAFVMPLSVIFIYLIFSKKIRDISVTDWAISFLIFMAIALPWHISQFILHGREFIDLYFLDQMIGRRVGAGVPIAISNPFFFFKVIMKGFFPWSMVLPFAFLYNAITLYKSKRNEFILLFTWIFLVLLICSTITSKYFLSILQNWYILPIYPVLAIIIGRFLVDLVKGVLDRRIFAFSIAGLIIALSLFTPDMHYNPFEKQSFKSLMELSYNYSPINFGYLSERMTLIIPIILLCILGITAYYLLNKYNSKYKIVSKIISNVLCSYLLIISFVLILLPLRYSDNKSDFDRMSKKIWSYVEDGTILNLYGNNLPFYQDYIYLNNFECPDKITNRFIGIDDSLLFEYLSSAEKNIFFIERQHYYDLRNKIKFKKLMPYPFLEWDNYILLSLKSPSIVKEQLVINNIDALNNNNPEIRKTAALRLGILGHNIAISPLISLLDDSFSEVVSAAARALGDLRVCEAVVPLKKILSKCDEDEELYQSIMLALAYLRDKSSINFLVNNYNINPIYSLKKTKYNNPSVYFDHNKFWTIYLLLDIDPAVARSVISKNLEDFVKKLHDYGMDLTIYNRMLYQLYRLGNMVTLDILEHFLNSQDISIKKIALSLLAKPPAVITRMTQKEMNRAEYLLNEVAERENTTEVKNLANNILQKYHRNAWVSW